MYGDLPSLAPVGHVGCAGERHGGPREAGLTDFLELKRATMGIVAENGRRHHAAATSDLQHSKDYACSRHCVHAAPHGELLERRLHAAAGRALLGAYGRGQRRLPHCGAAPFG